MVRDLITNQTPVLIFKLPTKAGECSLPYGTVSLVMAFHRQLTEVIVSQLHPRDDDDLPVSPATVVQ